MGIALFVVTNLLDLDQVWIFSTYILWTWDQVTSRNVLPVV